MSTSSKEIQVNVVLEESPSNRLNQQTVRMVGFIIIDNANITLSDLRSKIIDQFDEQQLKIIGLNFKFLKRTFPVSSKQESVIKMQSLCISLSNHNKPDHQNTAFLLN